MRRSGRHVFRVWFGDSPAGVAEATTRTLGALGCLTERSFTNLLAVDAAHASMAQAVADLLMAAENAGTLTFEASVDEPPMEVEL